MGTIEKELTDLFANKKDISGVDSKSLDDLEKSVKDFHELLESGVVKPRGYNLLTIDGNAPSFGFNNF